MRLRRLVSYARAARVKEAYDLGVSWTTVLGLFAYYASQRIGFDVTGCAEENGVILLTGRTYTGDELSFEIDEGTLLSRSVMLTRRFDESNFDQCQFEYEFEQSFDSLNLIRMRSLVSGEEAELSVSKVAHAASKGVHPQPHMIVPISDPFIVSRTLDGIAILLFVISALTFRRSHSKPLTKPAKDIK